MQEFFRLPDLQLFAEGGEAGTGGAQEAEAVPGANPSGDPHAAGGGEKQADNGQGGQKQSFEALLKADPDYKRAYDQRVKKAIEGRFRQQRVMESEQERLNPILDILGKRYGLAADENGRYDLESLGARLRSEEAQIGAAENAAVPGEKRRGNDSPAAFLRFHQQAEAVKQIYPGFDPGREMRNPAFGRLIAAGVDAKTAYEAAHRDEILGGAMRFAVQQTRQKLSDSILAGAKRPVENALGGQSTATHIQDPAKLTRAQREELRARVARGEKVVW